MVVKFFPNKKGGSSKAIDYLLNEREKQGTARVLQGDPNLTKQIINSIKFKQKTTVGCLSFEEKNISEDMKYQLMEDFEKHLLPGMQDRYNILWVEHTDKGRLELNFVIPKIDLVSQKSLNPYYHKADLPRVEKWQDLQNIKFNFTNPKDPSKARTLQSNPKEIGLSKDYEQLDKLLHNLTLEGQIKNRDNLIELLQSNQIEVTRRGKDYLSIKLPDSKKAKKFKGSIYNEQFTSTRQIETISETAKQRAREYDNRDTQEEQQRLTRELESYTRAKSKKYREIYRDIEPKTGELYRVIEPKTGEKDREFKQQPNTTTQEQAHRDRGKDRGEARTSEHTQNGDNSNNNIHSNNSDNIRNSLLYNHHPIHERQRADDLLLHKRHSERQHENKGAINDSTRTTINERIGTRETNQYKGYIETESTRNQLLEVLRKSAESIRKQSIANSTELPKEYAENRRGLQQRIEIIEREHSLIVQKSESHLQQARNIEQQARNIEQQANRFTKLRELGNRLGEAIDSTREIITQKFNNVVSFIKNKFHYKNENLEKETATIEVKKEPTLRDIKKLEKNVSNEFEKDKVKHAQEEQKQINRRHHISR